MRQFDKASVAAAFAAMACALVVACSIAFAWGGFAWAEGEDETQKNPNESTVYLDPEKNVINENQLPDTSFIYDSSIEELASADSYYDMQTVQVVGEATGDIVSVDFDEDHCWVMLWEASKSTNGGSNTLTVYMTREDAALIDTLGSYSRVGTTLQVRGEFHLVCSEHNGVSDLHATHVSVTKRGGVVEHPFEFKSFIPGILLLALGGGLFYLFNRAREKER